MCRHLLCLLAENPAVSKGNDVVLSWYVSVCVLICCDMFLSLHFYASEFEECSMWLFVKFLGISVISVLLASVCLCWALAGGCPLQLCMRTHFGCLTAHALKQHRRQHVEPVAFMFPWSRIYNVIQCTRCSVSLLKLSLLKTVGLQMIYCTSRRNTPYINKNEDCTYTTISTGIQWLAY